MPKSITVKKPRPDFPIFPHATGRWAKRVRGKLIYFGKTVDDPKSVAALEKWHDQRDDLLAGRTPRVQGEGLTVRDLVNAFLTSKKLQVKAGELTPRSWADYHATCERIIKAFGKTRLVSDLAADDFERPRAGLAKKWGPVAIGNEIQRVSATCLRSHRPTWPRRVALKNAAGQTLRYGRCGLNAPCDVGLCDETPAASASIVGATDQFRNPYGFSERGTCSPERHR